MNTFKAFKKDGELQNREHLLNWIDSRFAVSPNGTYDITIKRFVKKRTTDQNSLLWLWLTCIERETGNDKNDLYDYYCTKFLRKTVEINGEVKTVITGSSKLNTIGMKDFLDKIQVEASTILGITLPNPDDLQWGSFEETYKRYI